jgi:hypothetical protein
LVRHRSTLIEGTTALVNRIQKALTEMNLRLSLVVSDITGVTGLAILRDILAGERSPVRLAQHRDPRCRASEAEIAAALTGNYRTEHLFVLQQQVELYDVYQQKLAACDTTIAAQLHQLIVPLPSPARPVPTARSRMRAQGNAPRFDLRTPLHHLTGGVDLSQIDGLAPYSALKLLAEIGTDMSRWPTEKHFTSWLSLAPQNKISGGRLLSSRTPSSANRAAAILRLAASSLERTRTALGAFYRRLAYRVGKAKAITATARKLAILVYRMLKERLQYADPGAEAYEARRRTHTLRRLRQQAHHLGFGLIDLATGEITQSQIA